MQSKKKNAMRVRKLRKDKGRVRGIGVIDRDRELDPVPGSFKNFHDLCLL